MEVVMNETNLICSITDNYLTKAGPFLETLKFIKRARVWCVCHGFKPPRRFPALYPWITFTFMPFCPSQSHGMIQHGRFLDSLPMLGKDDLIVLSDADVLVQRDFSLEELKRFHAYDHSTLGVGNNNGEDDTLLKEAKRIEILEDEMDHYEHLKLGNIPVYNCGLMVARAGLFRRVQEEYEKDCYGFYGRCYNRSRCQFHFCLAIHNLGIAIDRIGGEIHTHGHFGVPLGAEFRSKVSESDSGPIISQVYFRGKLVMFRHSL
jgi:hypothetical protein